VIRIGKSPWGVPVGYCLIGIFSLIPIALFLVTHDFSGVWYVVASFVLFTAGFYFRSIDLKVRFSHGTHWLWHLCGGAAVQLLLTFVYLSSKIL
jgi:hemolysin III